MSFELFIGTATLVGAAFVEMGRRRLNAPWLRIVTAVIVLGGVDAVVGFNSAFDHMRADLHAVSAAQRPEILNRGFASAFGSLQLQLGLIFASMLLVGGLALARRLRR
jgi:hypothetical protein